MLQKSAIKYIQSLQQKKFRDEYGVFVAEGPKVVEELMKDASFVCQGIYSLEDWEQPGQNPSWPVTFITTAELERISGLSTPNTVLAVFRKKTDQSFSPGKGITLLLDDIRDPGNLGTIIRTADWFGVRKMVCSPGTADFYNPKVVQSTMASLGRVNIIYCDLPSWLSENKGPSIFAAALKGKSLSGIRPAESSILIIGNESSGISESVLQMADECIAIPGKGKAESLNAAVAAGIILYHFSV